MTHVLWSPEKAACSQCGDVHPHVRRFTANGSQTMFCQSCWDGFVDECNVSSGTWKAEVRKDWQSDVNLRLEFEEADGAAQAAGLWN